MKTVAVILLFTGVISSLLGFFGFPPTPSELVGEPSRQSTCHEWALDNAYQISDRLNVSKEFEVLFDACMEETIRIEHARNP